MPALKAGKMEELDVSCLERGPGPTDQPPGECGLSSATPDAANHYKAFLQLCNGHCGLCLVRTLAEGGKGPSQDMAHDWQRCPSLSTYDARKDFWTFRTSIIYSPWHMLCWVCHIANAGHIQLHADGLLEDHPSRRVGLMMAWGIFLDPQLKEEAYHDLVLSSACLATRRHTWDTARGFAEWIMDKDATGEPTSVMALMNFVRKKYM
ncbi:hypothetical protein FB107DRAFT_280870 [Schizophyllum commune]